MNINHYHLYFNFWTSCNIMLEDILESFSSSNESVTKPVLNVQIRLESLYNCCVCSVLLPPTVDTDDYETMELINHIFGEFDSQVYKLRSRLVKFEVVKEKMDISFQNILFKRFGWIMSRDYPLAIYGVFTAKIIQSFRVFYVDVETTMSVRDIKTHLKSFHLNSNEYVGQLMRHHLILPDTLRLDNLFLNPQELEYFELSCVIDLMKT